MPQLVLPLKHLRQMHSVIEPTNNHQTLLMMNDEDLEQDILYKTAESALIEESPQNDQMTVGGGLIIPPPLPILKKQMMEFERPKCPIEHIKFM
jgi:hypothetical protein